MLAIAAGKGAIKKFCAKYANSKKLLKVLAKSLKKPVKEFIFP